MHISGRGGIADLLNFLELLDMAKDAKKSKPLLADIMNREAALSEKQQALTVRENKLKAELDTIEDRKAEAQKTCDAADAKSAKNDVDKKEIAAAKREIDVARDELKQLKADLEVRAAEISEREQAYRKQLDAVRRAEQKLKLHEAELDTKAKRIREALMA